MKALKITAIVIVVLVLFVFALYKGAMFAANKYLSGSPKVQETVSKAAKNALGGRDMKIGEVKVALDKVIIKDFKIFEPGESKEVFMQAAALKVETGEGGILKNDPDIAKVTLESPSLNLIKRKDGTYNVSDLMKKNKTSFNNGKANFGNNKGKLELNNVNFTYTDEATGEIIKASDFNAQVKGVSQHDPALLEIELTPKTPGAQPLTIYINPSNPEVEDIAGKLAAYSKSLMK